MLGPYKDVRGRNHLLAGGFDGFFLLGLFILFFFLVLVANDFEDSHFGIVADSIASVDDAGIHRLLSEDGSGRDLSGSHVFLQLSGASCVGSKARG